MEHIPSTPRRPNTTEIRIGVSACIVGDQVRFDGGHKRDRFVTDVLERYVTFVRVCPEVEIGLGIPRETLRLVGSADNPRLVNRAGDKDHTATMVDFAEAKMAALRDLDLSGYILQAGSPSCGMERVRVYAKDGVCAKVGRGIFAAALLKVFPHLPVEEDGRLNDDGLRENFVERVFAYRRIKDLFQTNWTVGQLVRFHTAEKLLLLVHNTEAYRQLGRLVAQAKGANRDELANNYTTLYMAALSTVAKRGQHTNTLQHIMGYFRDHLSEAVRADLHRILHDYAAGLVPLIVPLTFMQHYARLYDIEYLQQQVYLSPDPKEILLRNRIG